MNPSILSSLKVIIPLFLLTLFFHISQQAIAQPTNLQHILPLGDSRVAGAASFESYRYELWKNLVSNNWTFDFIGTRTDQQTYPSFMGQNFDVNHQGVGGYKTQNILNTIENNLQNVPPPDIVLLGIGGNDLRSESSVGQVIENIREIIDILQANNSAVTIILEQIAPGRSDIMIPQAVDSLNKFNAQIATIPSQQNTTTSKIVVVDMANGWSDAYMSDNTHYNEQGAKLVADRYYATLAQTFGLFNILPLGDSRVEGFRPEYESYRYELWKNLVDNNWNFDFIGPFMDDATYPTFMGQSFDTDHAGVGGFTTEDVLMNLPETLDNTPTASLVLLGIGGNDLLEGSSVSQAIQNINDIIDLLQADNNMVTIFLEQIAPARSDLMTPQFTALHNQFNNQIANIPNQQTTASSKVIVVDMTPNWSDTYMADDVHYNEQGAKVVADHYFAALEQEFGMPTNVNPKAMILPDVHDPAQLVRIGDQIVLFASAVEWWTFDINANTWIFQGDDIYANGSPNWYNGSNLWAPSIVEHAPHAFRLYHSSVTNEEQHQSKIGFATVQGTTPPFSFIPSSDYVLESTNTNQPFAIDPAVFKDKMEKLWLVYGSHAEGIWMAELDETTGLLKENPTDKTWQATDNRFTNIANYGGALTENNIEAAYIYNHPENPYYYLFVNWDVCCSGVNSSYNIKVGRSTSPTGPFLDENGLDLRTGNGRTFLDNSGQILGDNRFIGPGHSGIYQHTDSKYYFSHHFYDGNNNGEPALAIWNLNWDNDWPQIDLQTEVSFSPIPNVTTLSARVTLSGAYNSTAQTMTTHLSDHNLITNAHPYTAAPWNHNETVNISGGTNNIVDWILLEVLDENLVSQMQRVALLDAQGNLRDVDGSNQIKLLGLPPNENYFLLLSHRNHVDVISNLAVSVNNTTPYDFSAPNFIKGGANQLTDLGNGNYGLVAGDFDGNGVISVSDFNQYVGQLGTTAPYAIEDVNFDGAITVDDFNGYSANASRIGVGLVRY